MSTDRRKALVEKIRLLFNRAERAVLDADDPTSVDHEAQLALETARRLMLQHGIEESELEGATVKKGTTAEGGAMVVALSMRKPAAWVFSLACTVGEYFSTKSLYVPPSGPKPGEVIFCGVKIASETAAYAFHSVLNQIRVLSRKYKVPRGPWEKNRFLQLAFSTFENYSLTAKSEYCLGIVLGLSKRLEELKKQEAQNAEDQKITALAISYSTVADEVALRINPEIEELPKQDQKRTGMGHIMNGVRDSKDVHVTQGLEAPKEGES